MTRISQTRCFASVFLLSYSLLRSSPSTWMCAPLVSVLANSESLPKTTQRVPFGVRDVLVVVLVRGLGCQRECREAAVVAGANFWVAAEKADEGYFVLVHKSVSVC